MVVLAYFLGNSRDKKNGGEKRVEKFEAYLSIKHCCLHTL